MSKFQLSATKWSKLVCSAVLVSGLSNTASAQQSSFEGLPSFPGLTQTGATPTGATQASTPQSSTAPQVGTPQSQTAISEQQLINSMPSSMAPAAQNPLVTQSPATVQSAVQSAVGAMGTGSDEIAANATAVMEDAHATQMESTLTELEAAHAHAYNTLAAVLDKVPADARPAIQQAMEQSRQGYQKARDNRERVVAHKMNTQNARRGRNSGNGPNAQHMQAGQPGQHGQHSQPRSNGQPGFDGQPRLDGRQGQFAGQQSNMEQGSQSQQGYAGQRPNPIHARTASGPSQPSFGTAQFNTVRDSTVGTPSGTPQSSMQGSTLGLIETSTNPQANPSTPQPGNRNYSTPEMNRAAPGRPLINGVNGANGTAQGNNFGVPANQRNANFGTNQPGSVQGSNGQNANGQNSIGQGMSRPSAADLNRYNQTKPSPGYNSQPTNTTGSGSTPTGSAPGSGFNGFGTRQ